MDSNQVASSSGGGLSFTGLLTIVFIVLKLCGVIDWSWWWVLSPAIIGMVLAIIMLIIVIIVLSNLE